MKKSELIRALQEIRGDPEVFVAGLAVEGVTTLLGRVNRNTYGPHTFIVRPDKPRDEVVTLTTGIELSDGTWDQAPIGFD